MRSPNCCGQQPFALGQRDLSDRFQVPQRLHGREREVLALRVAFARVVAQGRPELVLVSGYSGIGKSSLVAELHQPVVRERGFFLTGKCDQYNRGVPYLPFLQAFRGLLQEILYGVESKPNAGATFVVELPLRPPAADHQHDPDSA